MSRHRVQSIIIQNEKVLFGYGCVDRANMVFRHFFIGGGVEKNESPEDAIIREIREEANIAGKIIFKLSNESIEMRTTFLVDIGNQEPLIGYDPEEIDVTEEYKVLQKLMFIPLKNQNEFTQIDIDHFKILLRNCENRRYYPEWYNEMYELVTSTR